MNSSTSLPTPDTHATLAGTAPSEVPTPPRADPAPGRITGRTTVEVLVAVVVTTALMFGALLLAGKTIPWVAENLGSWAAWFVPVHAASTLTVTWVILRRRGVTARQVGVVRPGLGMLHLLWQIPLILPLIALVNVAFFTAMGHSEPPESAINALFSAGPVEAAALFAGVAILTPVW